MAIRTAHKAKVLPKPLSQKEAMDFLKATHDLAKHPWQALEMLLYICLCMDAVYVLQKRYR